MPKQGEVPVILAARDAAAAAAWLRDSWRPVQPVQVTTILAAPPGSEAWLAREAAEQAMALELAKKLDQIGRRKVATGKAVRNIDRRLAAWFGALEHGDKHQLAAGGFCWFVSRFAIPYRVRRVMAACREAAAAKKAGRPAVRGQHLAQSIDALGGDDPRYKQKRKALLRYEKELADWAAQRIEAQRWAFGVLATPPEAVPPRPRPPSIPPSRSKRSNGQAQQRAPKPNRRPTVLTNSVFTWRP